jgi:hypothetical protein
MFRHYEYKGYVVSIGVETRVRLQRRAPCLQNFTAVVQVAGGCTAMPLTPPLRLAGRTGVDFHTEADALMGGYAAGQRLVDDLLRADR